MSRRSAIVAIIALLSLGATPLPAQIIGTDSALVPGQRARLTYEHLRRPLIGEFVSADSGEIIMRSPGGTGLYYIKWDNVAELEASVAQRSRGETVLRGVLTGWATGLALGGTALLLGELIRRNTDGVRTAAFRGTVLTTIGGGIIGLSWPLDTWQAVPLEEASPRLTLVPFHDGRLRLGLNLAAPRGQ